MTHLLIDSEHDMETSITYLTGLAKLEGPCTVKLTFPSVLLLTTFMDNLLVNFQKEDVPRDTKLDLDVFVPPPRSIDE